jgi:hypothetical protein
LHTYGTSSWPALKKLYINFSQDKNIDVIKTILMSIHEVAKILGEELSKTDLEPIYNTFILADNKEIRKLAIQRIPFFLKACDSNSELRSKFLRYFKIITLENFNSSPLPNWRGRIEIIKNYISFFELYEPHVIYSQMLPLLIQFTFDNVRLQLI